MTDIEQKDLQTLIITHSDISKNVTPLIRRRKFDLLFCVPRARPENAPRIDPFYPQNPRVKAFYYQFLPIFAKHE